MAIFVKSKKKVELLPVFNNLPPKTRYCNNNLLPLHRDLISQNEGDFVTRQTASVTAKTFLGTS